MASGLEGVKILFFKACALELDKLVVEDPTIFCVGCVNKKFSEIEHGHLQHEYVPELWCVPLGITKMVNSPAKRAAIFYHMGQFLINDQQDCRFVNISTVTVLDFFGHIGYFSNLDGGDPFFQVEHDKEWQEEIKKLMVPIQIILQQQY